MTRMRMLIAVALAVALLTGEAARAQQTTVVPEPTTPLRFRIEPPFEDPNFVRGPVPPPDKSYWIPLVEVLTIDLAIWGYNYAVGKEFAKISVDSIKDNFNKGWIIDTDDFWANGILHPLHGNLTFTAARSMGLNFYESFGYAFLGSLVWEQFLEIQPPSVNDQINTPFGGSVVGEALFRLSRMVLDGGGYDPGGWRQFFAFLLAPAPGINRLMFHDRYRGELMIPKSWSGEFRFGAVLAGSNTNYATGARNVTVGPWAAFSTDIIYGMPDSPDLELKSPFDHFTLSASVAATGDMTHVPVISALIRGLLVGDTLHFSDTFRGVGGLFTSYDFIAPVVFRVSSFGIGPGITLTQRWGNFQLDGTIEAEALTWANAGSTIALGAKDYHSGPGADAVIEFRGQYGDRVTARLEAREFWVTGAYARGSSEDISYVRGMLTVRIVGPHAVSAGADFGFREATYPDQPRISERASTVSVSYTLLSGW